VASRAAPQWRQRQRRGRGLRDAHCSVHLQRARLPRPSESARTAAREQRLWRARSARACAERETLRSFHCDEALACFLLGRTKQFAGASIVRTRDPAVLKVRASASLRCTAPQR
jgi:hypothetical protein